MKQRCPRRKNVHPHGAFGPLALTGSNGRDDFEVVIGASGKSRVVHRTTRLGEEGNESNPSHRSDERRAAGNVQQFAVEVLVELGDLNDVPLRPWLTEVGNFGGEVVLPFDLLGRRLLGRHARCETL